MLDLSQSFSQMVVADLTDKATSEESAYLRADENLEAWRRELADYIVRLGIEVKRRKSVAIAFKNQADNWAERNDALAESLEFEANAGELKRKALTRIGEAKARIKELKARRHEENQRRMQERRAVAETSAGHYRGVLHDIRLFLESDEAFKEEFLPMRDRVLGKVDQTLCKDKEGIVEEHSIEGED